MFERAYYQQIFGTAMGNPLSPIIAEYVMEDLLDNAVAANTVVIPFLKKYVDDLFLALPLENVEDVEIFNQQNEHIQFTVEREENSRLPFLDMLLVRQENHTIKTEWYRKAIASGRFLNYHSGHPISMKMNVAFNFAKRVLRFSTNISLKQAKTIIFGLLRLNDYPSNIINRVIHRASGNPTNGTAMEVSSNENDQEEPTKTYYSLTNIHGLTQTITKTLRREFPNAHIASKQRKNIGSLLPTVKDRTPIEDRHNVIYQVDCADCDACYIGMTTQKLKARLSKHKSNMTKLQTLQNDGHTTEDAAIQAIMETTALVNHAALKNHTFKLGEARILDTTHKGRNLPILESCHINNTSNTINKRTDTDNLHIAYAGVLHWMNNFQQNRRTRNA
ncbi:uncharacterized protein LOC134291108 [Aedes albopictus]|uniref:Reverse transcriptase domain-containing protein n=1 Tax=Aedes albopictus TaxID=7160 RepID=A0ABM1YFF1_AEDAL